MRNSLLRLKKFVIAASVFSGSLLSTQAQAFTPFSTGLQLPSGPILSIVEDPRFISTSSPALGSRQVFRTNTRYCNGAIVDLLYNFHQNQTGPNGGPITYADQSLMGAPTTAASVTTVASMAYPGTGGSPLYKRDLASQRFATTLAPSLTPAPTPLPQSWGITDIYGTLVVYTPLVPVSLCAAPATLTKSFAPVSVTLAQPSVLTLTINNSAGNPAKSGMSFIDTLPAGLVASSIASNSCGGAASVSSGGQVSLTGGAFTAGTASCQVVVQIAGLAATVSGQSCKAYQNGPSNFSGLANVTATAANATLLVTCPPAATSTLRIEKIGNAPPPPAPNTNINGLFTFDVICTTPTGAQWVNPNNPVTLNYTGATIGANVTGIPTGSACTVLEKVSTSAYNAPTVTANIVTIGGVTTAANGYAVTTSALQGPSAASPLSGAVMFKNSPIVAQQPVAITKAFSPSTVMVAQTQTSVLTFTLTNAAGNAAVTGVNFTDNLPSGMAASNVVSNTCGGSATAPGAAATTVSLAGGTLAAGPSSCTIQVAIMPLYVCKPFVNNASNFSGLANASAATANATLNAVCPIPTQSVKVTKYAVPAPAPQIPSGVYNFVLACGGSTYNFSMNYPSVKTYQSPSFPQTSSPCNISEADSFPALPAVTVPGVVWKGPIFYQKSASTGTLVPLPGNGGWSAGFTPNPTGVTEITVQNRVGP